jgi:hypothetical protein
MLEENRKQYETQLEVEKVRIQSEEAEKARSLLSLEIKEKASKIEYLQQLGEERDQKLAQAQQSEANYIRLTRELEDKVREVDLTVQKKVKEEQESILAKAKNEADEAHKLTVEELKKTISTLTSDLEQAKNRAEQGSQQMQGEVQELELESMLRNFFPYDVITPVPKGIQGADTIQEVRNEFGQSIGTIIWESKRTKGWNNEWLSKLKSDQQNAKSTVAVIVTATLPSDINTFGLKDGVWISDWRSALPLAVALREQVIEVGQAKITQKGIETKSEQVYLYLTGQQFKMRVERITEAFHSLHDDLIKEKKAMTKLWAKREQQLAKVIQSTSGMYGDLQGIAGQSMQTIDGLEFDDFEDDDEAESKLLEDKD